MGRAVRQLERSTAESWVGIGLGLFTAVVPMTWYWELTVLGVIFALSCDFVVRSAWTINLRWSARIGLCWVALAALLAAAGPSIIGRYFATAARGANPPSPIAGILIADYYLTQPRVWAAIGAVVLLLLTWSWRPVWRFRHRVIFRARRIFVEQVWIKKQEAFNVLIKSSWAYARKAANDQSAVSIWLTIPSMTKTRSRQSRDDMFIGWCQMALRQFVAERPDAEREVEGEKEIDETALRAWIQGRYDADLIKEFGAP